jgi:hypothetical protein
MACIQQQCSSCGAKRFAEIDVRYVVPERSFLCVMCQTRMGYVEMQVNLDTYVTSVEKTEVGEILLGQKL